MLEPLEVLSIIAAVTS